MNTTELLAIQSNAAALATPVALSSPDHGPRHWRDVARVGLDIGQAAGLGVDMLQMVFVFAAVHDTQRLNEFDDPDHGRRAADIMPKLELPFHEKDKRRLGLAVTQHDKGGVDSDVLVGVCWDADRLTLGRVGIEPKRLFMSTRTVQEDFGGRLALGMSIVHGHDLTWQEIAGMYSSV